MALVFDNKNNQISTEDSSHVTIDVLKSTTLVISGTASFATPPTIVSVSGSLVTTSDVNTISGNLSTAIAGEASARSSADALLTPLTTTAAISGSLMPKSGGTFSGPIASQKVSLTDAATITVDASLGNIFDVTLGGNRTLANPTNPTDGQLIMFTIRQDSTGGRLLTFSSSYSFSITVTQPTLSTSANKVDLIGFKYDSVLGKWLALAWSIGY